MNRIIRAFAAFIVSICLILAPSIQYANAASSWSITSAVSAGARTVVTSTKSGYKSAVNIAPTAGRLGVKLIKMGRSTALVYAVGQLLDGVDWVLDPANNRIIYKVKAADWGSQCGFYNSYGVLQYLAPNNATGVANANAYYAGTGRTFTECSVSGTTGACSFNGGTSQLSRCNATDSDAYLPIDEVAAQVIKNAQSGHAESQAVTKDTAVEMVIGGQFDQDLLAGAVPTSDNKPLVPSVPISGNGNVSHGSDVGVGTGDSGMSGASPGEQADAAKDAAEKAKKAAQAAADAAKDAAQAASDAADNAADLVNSGADAAAVAAAEAAQAAAEKAAADAKAVSDAAVAAANERAAAAERAAEAATQAAQDAAAQAASDVAAAQASGDSAAIAAAEAAKAAADAAVAAAKEKQAAAEKAAEKAKAEAAKPFELPAFCSWATKVCDFVDWVKADPQLEEPDMTKPEIQDLNKYDNIDISQNYISATGQCPPAVDLNINFGLVKLSYEPLCLILDKLSGVIVAVAYISAGFMIVRTV